MTAPDPRHIDALAAAACRATHPTRFEYRALAHACQECVTGATGVLTTTDPAAREALLSIFTPQELRAEIHRRATVILARVIEDEQREVQP